MLNVILDFPSTQNIISNKKQSNLHVQKLHVVRLTTKWQRMLTVTVASVSPVQILVLLLWTFICYYLMLSESKHTAKCSLTALKKLRKNRLGYVLFKKNKLITI